MFCCHRTQTGPIISPHAGERLSSWHASHANGTCHRSVVSARIARKRHLSRVLTMTTLGCRLGTHRTQTGLVTSQALCCRLGTHRTQTGMSRHRPSVVVSARIARKQGCHVTGPLLSYRHASHANGDVTSQALCCRIGTHRTQTGMSRHRPSVVVSARIARKRGCHVTGPHDHDPLLSSRHASHANGDVTSQALCCRLGTHRTQTGMSRHRPSVVVSARIARKQGCHLTGPLLSSRHASHANGDVTSQALTITTLCCRLGTHRTQTGPITHSHLP